MLNPHRGAGRVSFDTTGKGAGVYCAQQLILRPESGTKGSGFDSVEELVMLLENTPPLNAQVEIDLLRVGGDENLAGDWTLNVANGIAKGVYDPLKLAGWSGVRIRCKSGGTDGVLNVSARWH